MTPVSLKKNRSNIRELQASAAQMAPFTLDTAFRPATPNERLALEKDRQAGSHLWTFPEPNTDTKIVQNRLTFGAAHLGRHGIRLVRTGERLKGTSYLVAAAPWLGLGYLFEKTFVPGVLVSELAGAATGYRAYVSDAAVIEKRVCDAIDALRLHISRPMRRADWPQRQQEAQTARGQLDALEIQLKEQPQRLRGSTPICDSIAFARRVLQRIAPVGSQKA